MAFSFLFHSIISLHFLFLLSLGLPTKLAMGVTMELAVKLANRLTIVLAISLKISLTPLILVDNAIQISHVEQCKELSDWLQRHCNFHL